MYPSYSNPGATGCRAATVYGSDRELGVVDSARSYTPSPSNWFLSNQKANQKCPHRSATKLPQFFGKLPQFFGKLPQFLGNCRNFLKNCRNFSETLKLVSKREQYISSSVSGYLIHIDCVQHGFHHGPTIYNSSVSQRRLSGHWCVLCSTSTSIMVI